MTTVADIAAEIERVAPLEYQEEYDNCGLICGNAQAEIKGVLICLDCTEAVVDEAIKNGCNMVVSHHPVVFKGLKKITGKNFVERVIIKAIENRIAIYAAHTNLDNVKEGVNKQIGERLGLKELKILQPKQAFLRKLVTFCPVGKAKEVRRAIFDAGGGYIGNYSNCSFNIEGYGTFKAEEGADPYVGEVGEEHQEREERIEIIFPAYLEEKIIHAMMDSHPYEEVAYDVYSLSNRFNSVGSGMVGMLQKPLEEKAFLQMVKEKMIVSCLRYSPLSGKKIEKVAVCGGSGAFLMADAKRLKCDAFVTADVKYHQFFDTEGKILLADIGHYESEQFTQELIFGVLKKKFSNFALRLAETNTNPVNYL